METIEIYDWDTSGDFPLPEYEYVEESWSIKDSPFDRPDIFKGHPLDSQEKQAIKNYEIKDKINGK